MNKNFADMSDTEIDAWVQELAEKHKAGVLDITNANVLDSEEFFQLAAAFSYNEELVSKYGAFYKDVYYEAGRRYSDGAEEATE